MSGKEKIEYTYSDAEIEDSFSLLVPLLFFIFLICMAQLNCYIESRRFGHSHDNRRS